MNQSLGLSIYNNNCNTYTLSLENCIEFDGISEFGHSTTTNYPTNDYTIEFWIKDFGFQPSANLGHSYIFSNGSVKVAILGESILKWFSSGSGSIYIEVPLSVVPGFNPNQWLHVVLRYTRATIGREVFLNGVMVSASNGTTATIGYPSYLAIGAGGGSATSMIGYYKGLLDEFRLYTRLLTESEIQHSYNNGMANFPLNREGLIHWYPFEKKGMNIGSLGNQYSLIMKNFINDPKRPRNS